MVWIPQVAMGGKEGEVRLRLNQGVICHTGEGQHHLVHLCLAVAPHGQNPVLQTGEHGDDILGPVALGQIVPGTVIEQIPQKEQLVRIFRLYPVQKLAAKQGGAVNV